MARTNGKSEVELNELDTEHELPAADQAAEAQAPTASAAGPSPLVSSEELQKLTAERDALLDRLARSQAEFENARKRAAREQQDFREYALADTVKNLLPILDSFEHALKVGAGENSEFHSGVELIYKQLQDALTKMGLRTVPAQGQPFDPRVHEAIEMVESTDAPDHQVLQELQHGYKLKDRLLRPAMVRVARNPKG
jgi:molecular chaperone GrpE